MLLVDPIQIKQYFLEQVKLDGLKLSDLSEELRSDKEIVLAAIEQNSYAIQFASQNLRNDEEVVGAAFKEMCNSRNRSNPGGYSIINYASDRIRNDEDLLLSWLQYDHELILRFPQNYLGEAYFMKKAISKNPMVLCFGSQEIKNNRQLVLLGAKKRGWFLENPGFSQFYTDREIMLEACKSSSCFFEILPDQFRNDHDFVLEVLKNCNVGTSVIKYIPDSILNNKEIILNGFLLNFELLLFVLKRPELLNDGDFILEIYRLMYPSYSSIKQFSFLLYWTWKKKGLFDGNETQGYPSKEELISKIIAINPLSEPYFQTYAKMKPKFLRDS